MGCCFSKVFCKMCRDSSLDTLSEEEEEITEDAGGSADCDSNEAASPATADVEETNGNYEAVDNRETIGSGIEYDLSITSSNASVEKENSDEDRSGSVAHDGQKAGFFYIDNGKVVNLSRVSTTQPEHQVYKPTLIAGRIVPTVRPTTAWSRYLEDGEVATTSLSFGQNNMTACDGGRYSHCSWKYLPEIRNQQRFGNMSTAVARDTRKRQERPVAAKGARTPNCFSQSEVTNMTIQRTIAPKRPFRHTYFWKPISDQLREMLETWERRQAERDTEKHGHC